jgi:4-methyl-5(b-hydroxyethyl)-thiazole monophosphate biosynthesis
MANAVVILSPGFEEIEAVTIIDILRRAEIDVTVAGLEKGIIEGSHNIAITPDCYYQEITDKKYDLLVLPGGQPGSENLKKDERLLQWLRERSVNNEKTAAICAAPIVLQAAGITDKINITSYPSEKEVFHTANYLEDSVVKDNNIITSRGVATAIEFALELVSELAGEEKSRDIGEKILYKLKE